MKLINKKRFNAQFNKDFSQGYLTIVLLLSIIFGSIVSLWLPYDINKPYKGMNIGGILIFLCIMVLIPGDTEILKRDISYFISLNYCRREYFKNKIIIVNLFIGISVVFSTIFMFTVIDYNAFGYFGFIMGTNFISFLEITLINIIIYNLIYTSIIIVKTLFNKVITNKVGNLILCIVWPIAYLTLWRGIGDIYIHVVSPNITLVCSILFIFIAYYIYYKFIMSLDV